MIDALPRIDPLSRALARFAHENGIGSVRRIRAFLSLDSEAFVAAARKWGWRERREAPKAIRLSAFLAGFDLAVTQTATPSPERAIETRALALQLRAFIGERLATLSALDAADAPAATTRDIVELTRCLKELMALEAKIDWNAISGRGDGDGAAMEAGAASDLAQIVALQVEQLHERIGAGGGLETLYAADEAASGSEMAAPGA
ncbi:MAG TPA: hypothetical protein VLQ65_13095 [Saliniramus sp.]|nr:hypothetical protein [Saliniramus sp.]